jgi:hypothetical protein
MTDHECPHWINIRPRYEADERHGRQCHLHPEDHTTDEAGWIIHATLIPNGAETWVVRDDSVSVGYGPGTTCSDRAYEIRWVSPPAEMAHGAP